jgi:hypothetical protein
MFLRLSVSIYLGDGDIISSIHLSTNEGNFLQGRKHIFLHQGGDSAKAE